MCASEIFNETVVSGEESWSEMWSGTVHQVFFSSRRRHTRYWRDWSSDVCSSDLERPSEVWHESDRGQLPRPGRAGRVADSPLAGRAADPEAGGGRLHRGPGPWRGGREIGRASCRVRV